MLTLPKIVNNKYFLYIFPFFILVLFLLFLVFKGIFGEEKPEKIYTPRIQGNLISPPVIIPETQEVKNNEGRLIENGSYETPLMPKNNEEIIFVKDAVLTLKDSFNLAEKNAIKWASDAKLVSIKSLGAITLEGKANQWQLFFGSIGKRKNYEIIILGADIIRENEIGSSVSGFDLPSDWYDSNDAIIAIQNLPQFSDAAISALNFYYNVEGKAWAYVLSTSRGATSMFVR